MLILDKVIDDEDEIQSFVSYCQNWLKSNGMFSDQDAPGLSHYTSVKDIGIDLQSLYLHLVDPTTSVILTPNLVGVFDIIDDIDCNPRVFSDSNIPELTTEPLRAFTFDLTLAKGLVNLSVNGFEYSAQLILAARIQRAEEPNEEWSQVEGFFQYLGLVFRYSANFDIDNLSDIKLPVEFFNRFNHDASQEIEGAIFSGYLMNEEYPREERSKKAQIYINESQSPNFHMEIAITLAVLHGAIDAPAVNPMMIPAIRAVLTNNYLGGAYYHIWQISVPISADFLNWVTYSFMDAYLGNKVPKVVPSGWSFAGAWSKTGGMYYKDRQLLLEYLSQGSPMIELTPQHLELLLNDISEYVPDGLPRTE